MVACILLWVGDWQWWKYLVSLWIVTFNFILSVKTDSQNNSWLFTSVLHVSKKTELKCDCTGSWKSNHIVTVLVTLYTTTQSVAKKKKQCGAKCQWRWKRKFKYWQKLDKEKLKLYCQHCRSKSAALSASVLLTWKFTAFSFIVLLLLEGWKVVCTECVTRALSADLPSLYCGWPSFPWRDNIADKTLPRWKTFTSFPVTLALRTDYIPDFQTKHSGRRF